MPQPVYQNVNSPCSTFSTQNKLFGNENKANDHTQKLKSKIRNKILPTYLQGNYRDSLGEFSNIYIFVFLLCMFMYRALLRFCEVLFAFTFLCIYIYIYIYIYKEMQMYIYIYNAAIYQCSIILHAKRSFLFCEESTWGKTEAQDLFDVTMGSWDGAETCELVGNYLLSVIQKKHGNNIGLPVYHDDCLGVFEATPQKVERIKKSLCKIF